jgi:histidine triad (HIT) family protein
MLWGGETTGTEGKMDCIFCQIAAGKIPGDILYQDDEIIAFRDINPQAPVHLLIIPRKHITSLAQLEETDSPLFGKMVNAANRLARSEGVSESGYRLAVNCGDDGGQIVPHLHLHLIGGRKLTGAIG